MHKSKAVKMALATSFISGFAVFMNQFAVKSWPNSSNFTTAKNIVAAMFLLSFLWVLGKMPELKKLSVKNWIYLVLIGFIGGSIPFLMFFKALTLVPAPEAAFIHKSLFLWAIVLAYFTLKEKISSFQFLALGLFASGIFLMGAPGQWSFGPGFWLALGATLFWAVENIIAKFALREISSSVLGWGRMFFGSLFLLVFSGLTGNFSGIFPDTLNQAWWAILSGLVLFGYVATWYWSLKHAPVVMVTSILVIAAPITALLNSVFVTGKFPAKVAIPSLLMILGIFFVSKQFDSLYSKFIRAKRPASA